MSFFFRALAALALFLSLPASASSLFADPAHPGEGWTFDNQNDRVAAAWYTYGTDQRASWALAVMRATYTEEGGKTIQRLEGDVTEITGRTTPPISRGLVSMQRSFENGQYVYNVQGPGFTRRLVPYLFNYANLSDQFHGFWVGTAFEPDDMGESASSLTLGMQFLGAVTFAGQPARTFVNPTTGTHGVVYYSPRSGLFEGYIFPADGGPTLAFGVEGDDRSLFGNLIAISDAGEIIDGSERLFSAVGVAPTDASGTLLLQNLGLPNSSVKASVAVPHPGPTLNESFLDNSRRALAQSRQVLGLSK